MTNINQPLANFNQKNIHKYVDLINTITHVSLRDQLSRLKSWDDLNNWQWYLTITCHPEFEIYCDFDKLYGNAIGGILRTHPTLADRCDFNKLNGADWASLLRERPRFVDDCDFDKLSARDWCLLLSDQPQMAHRCKLDSIASVHLEFLKRKQPQLFGNDVTDNYY